MLRFRCMRSLQKFVAVHSSIHNHFNQERHLYSRDDFSGLIRNLRKSPRCIACIKVEVESPGRSLDPGT